MTAHKIDWKFGDSIILGDWEPVVRSGMGTICWERRVVIIDRANIARVETLKIRRPILEGLQWVFETLHMVGNEWKSFCGACENPEVAKQIAEASLEAKI